MALRQQVEKESSGWPVQAMPDSFINAGIAGYTMAAAKYPYPCSLNADSIATSTGTYYDAMNLNVPNYAMPVDKNFYIGNETMPAQKLFKSKQPALNSKSRLNQQSTLDVAVPSSWRLRQHVSLDFDAHRQKVVSKRSQIAASWRHLSPQLKREKHKQTVVADVFEVPPELFQLKDLKDILSLKAWKECLSLSERRVLRQLLPEGFDHGSLVGTILRGDNLYFGSPLANWSSLLLEGELHPDCIEQREVQLRQAYDEHYSGLQNYHEKMLQTLRDLKEEWVLCKSKKSKLSSKTRRRKLKFLDSKAVFGTDVDGIASCKRQKIATSQQEQQEPEKMELQPIKDFESDGRMLLVENDIYSDDSMQFTHVLKVTRKQYDDILHLMGKADELLVATLSPLLNFQQKQEVICANACDEGDYMKTHEHWSKLVVADIAAGHIAFAQKKAEKYQVSKFTAEQCKQHGSLLMLKGGCKNLQSHKEPALGFQGSMPGDNNSRNSSASESSVTCLEGKIETQGAVVSCLTSADSTERVLSQHITHEDQASLIGLPHGSSLSTFLSQAPRELTNSEGCSIFDEHGTQPLESGISLVKSNLGRQEISSTGKDLVNWDIHSKIASNVVSITAASGESEEVEQRVTRQPGVEELDHPLYCLSAPSYLTSQQETIAKVPLFGLKYLANTKKEYAECQVLPEKIINLNTLGRSALSVPSSDEISQFEKFDANESSQAFEIDCGSAENEINNQMMLHLFLDDPKLHSNDFSRMDASSSQNLQGRSSFCEHNEVSSLASDYVSNPILRKHEPMTELNLLADDKTVQQTYQSDKAESFSSRTQNEYIQQCTMEPHRTSRHSKQGEPAYPFCQQFHELHHSVQSNQDAFSTMQPIWQQNAVRNVSHPSFANYWNIQEHLDHTSWIPSDGNGRTPSLTGKDECGRHPVSQYWDRISQSLCMTSQSSMQEIGVLGGNTLSLHDGNMYKSLDNGTHLQSSSHLPCTWAIDRSGKKSSHPQKNTSVLLSLQYEQQKLQNALLAKLNPNFTSSWL